MDNDDEEVSQEQVASSSARTSMGQPIKIGASGASLRGEGPSMPD